MRVYLQTVLCCCIFSSVLPPAHGATGEPSMALRKRFKVWLQSQTRRNQHSTLMTSDEMPSDTPPQNTAATASSPSTSHEHRAKRSTKPSGCALITCLYHDLVHLLHESTNQQKEPCAPKKKIGSGGYGRRRRSPSDIAWSAQQAERLRRCREAVEEAGRNNTVTA